MFSRFPSRSPYSRFFQPAVYFLPDDGTGAAGGGSTPPAGAPPAGNPNPQPQPQPQTQPEPPQPQPRAKKIDRVAQRNIDDVLARNGDDPNVAIHTLLGQVHALQESINTSDTDMQELAAYRAMGKPAEVKARIDAGDTAATKLTQRERAEVRTKAVKVDGFDPERVGLLAGIDSFEFEIRKEKVTDAKGNTSEVEVGYAKGKKPDGSDFNGRVSELITQVYAPMADSLKAGGGAPGGGVRIVTPYGKSAPAGGGQQLTAAERIREEEAARGKGRRTGGAKTPEADESAPRRTVFDRSRR